MDVKTLSKFETLTKLHVQFSLKFGIWTRALANRRSNFQNC